MYPEEGRTARKAPYPEIGSIEVRKKIGEEIRSAREFQQLSVDQVAEMTKINKRYIEAIEKGDWSFLPPTYVRAFITTAAVTAGLEAAEMENRLRDVFPKEALDQGVVQPSEINEESWIGRAWDGGLNGRQIIDQFITEVPNFLLAGGRILLVQSSLSDINRTFEMFKELGLYTTVIHEVKVSFETIILLESKI